MFKISTLTASALIGLSLATPALAKEAVPFQGVVIVPAASAPLGQASVQPRMTQPVLLAPELQTQPEFKRAKIVYFESDKPRGSIVVDTVANRLFYILGNNQAAMYRIATGKPGFEWAGTHKVSAKTEWPDWRPPATMLQRRPELPTFMAGGPENPLGARAIYLGSTLYRIHGTNEPSSIGKSVSSGCIRMLNSDVSELYKFVKVGTEVTVM